MVTQASFVKILIIILGIMVADRIGRRFLLNFLDRLFKAKGRVSKGDKEREDTIKEALANTLKGALWVAALLIILPELGVDIKALLAGVGVAGLAIAMASKQVVSDYVNGFFIILNDQYRIGDEVEVAGKKGRVRDIDFRRTLLKGKDGQIWFIPHNKVSVTSRREKEE